MLTSVLVVSALEERVGLFSLGAPWHSSIGKLLMKDLENSISRAVAKTGRAAGNLPSAGNMAIVI